MKFTLRQIAVYLATARHENISRAAQELHLSQSAASDALKTLENQFGIQLFDRAGKRLQLNELGRRLRPEAERLLAQAELLETAMQDGEYAVSELTIGATLSIGNYTAVELLARFQSEHPDIRVQLDVANTHAIAGRLLNYELDLAMVEGECNHPDLLVSPWMEDELVAFCHPESHLATRGKLLESDLTEVPWILREAGSGTRQAFEQAMHGLLPQLQIRLELQHTEAIKRAVEAGMGCGCLSRITLHEAFRRGSLVALEIPSRNLKRWLYLIRHRRKYLTPAMKRWITLCESHVQH